MLAFLAIGLGLVIVVSAIAADRAARAQHKLRAIGLNLCGIACLLAGLLTIFSWSRGGVDVTRRVAIVAPTGSSTTVVRLLVGSDGRLERPDQRAPSDDGAVAEAPEGRVQAEAEESRDSAPVPHQGSAAQEQRSDWTKVEAEMARELDDAGPELDLDPQQRSQVQIDFDARPEWVDRPEVNVGGIHQISVAAGPYTSRQAARRELYKKLKTATDQYINDYVGNSAASQWVRFSAEEIRRDLVAADHIYDEEVISPSFGRMHQSHALLQFGPAFHDEVDQAWHQVMARTQLVRVALFGGAVLGIIVLLFGYFNVDTATRGFYSRRLKFVTIVTILGMIAAGFLFARSIPWLWL